MRVYIYIYIYIKVFIKLQKISLIHGNGFPLLCVFSIISLFMHYFYPISILLLLHMAYTFDIIIAATPTHNNQSLQHTRAPTNSNDGCALGIWVLFFYLLFYSFMFASFYEVLYATFWCFMLKWVIDFSRNLKVSRNGLNLLAFMVQREHFNHRWSGKRLWNMKLWYKTFDIMSRKCASYSEISYFLQIWTW